MIYLITPILLFISFLMALESLKKELKKKNGKFHELKKGEEIFLGR